jgi:N-acetylglutamate synthase-like GNAT family acetyltransferase
MIRDATPEDFGRIYEIINDAASAYKGIIPADRWHEPYMTHEELREQIAAGVYFSCYVDDGVIVGVMGLQDRGDVYLIRHAYVMTSDRNKGIGSALIRAIIGDLEKPVLIGTWAAASWAVRFYEKHGFSLVNADEKNRLLARYWNVPPRQVETSVVLADAKYRT